MKILLWLVSVKSHDLNQYLSDFRSLTLKLSKKKKRKRKKKENTVKKMLIGTYVSIITLNVNG